MGPVVEKKLFGIIPFGNEPLHAGATIVYPDTYLRGTHGKKYRVEGGTATVSAVGETSFKISRGHAYQTYERGGNDGSHLRIRSRFGLTKTIRWTD